LDPYGVGVILHIDVFASTGLEPLAFTSDASGTGVAGYPIVNRPALVGKTLYAQAFWPWTTCSIPPNNVSSSRGLAFTIQGP
jgi:hypothetical protein